MTDDSGSYRNIKVCSSFFSCVCGFPTGESRITSWLPCFSRRSGLFRETYDRNPLPHQLSMTQMTPWTSVFSAWFSWRTTAGNHSGMVRKRTFVHWVLMIDTYCKPQNKSFYLIHNVAVIAHSRYYCCPQIRYRPVFVPIYTVAYQTGENNFLSG